MSRSVNHLLAATDNPHSDCRALLTQIVAPYILPHLSSAGELGQVVLTHPNTFTQGQCDTLRAAMTGAARAHLGEAWSERRVRLVSESEAVLHEFLSTLPSAFWQDLPPQRMMIYDFGAGTIDITLFDMDCRDGQQSVQALDLLDSVGINRAGNRIDILLAGLVDHQLASGLAEEFGFKYTLSLRGTARPGETRPQDVDFRVAIMRFRDCLLTAKIDFTRRWRSCNEIDVWADNGIAPIPDFAVNVTDLVEPTDIQFISQVEFERRLQMGVDAPQALWVGDVEDSDDRECYLVIPHRMVREKMEAFTTFAVDHLVETACHEVGCRTEDLDMVIPSGRGLLWPYILCRLRRTIGRRLGEGLIDPNRHGIDAKMAVVNGAVRWAQSHLAPKRRVRHSAVMAVRCHSSPPRIIEQGQWGQPVVLGCNQVSLVESCFTQGDVAASDDLRMGLYSPLGSVADVRHLANRSVVFRADENGVVFLECDETGETIKLCAGSESASDYRPGWPIGNIFLSDDELEP